MKTIQMFIVTGLLLSGAGQAAPLDINKDPYVVLYQLRVDMSVAAADRAKAEVELEKVRVGMAESLYPKRAVSFEELSIRRAAYEVAAADMRVMQARIREMEGVLSVVKFLRTAGRDVPLFPGQN